MFSFLKRSKKLKYQDDCSQYIDLETPCLIDPLANITKQGVRVTLVRINGSRNLVGDEKSEEYGKVFNSVLSTLNTFFNSDNITIAWMYEQDPSNTHGAIEETNRPTRNAAKKLGINSGLIYESLNEANANNCLFQDNVIAIWTTPEIQMEYVDGNVVPMKTENVDLKLLHNSLFQSAANPFLSDNQAIKTHKSNVQTLLDKLRHADVICDAIPAKKAAQWMLNMISPDQPKFTQLNYVDEKRIGIPTPTNWILNPGTSDFNLSAFMAEPLSNQMARQSVIEEGVDGVVKVGEQYFGTHTVDVMPKQEIPFNYLKKALNGVPCRITFIMKPKSKKMWAKFNETVNRYLGGVSQENKEYYRKMVLLDAMNEEFDYAPVNLQILIVTKGDTPQDISRHAESLSQALTDWGGSRVDYDNISPFQTYFSSIPGVNAVSHSDGCLIGSNKLASILPHQMDSSLDEYGPILFRHESGKICPFTPNNPKQDYGYNLYIARPRQGKSVLMNASTIASTMPEGATTIPLIVSIDIGPSSEGANQLLRLLMEDVHGKERTKRLIVSQKWDPANDGWKANPLDIRLGRNQPSAQEAEFASSFYSSVCAESDTGHPCKGGKEIIRSVIEDTFVRLSSHKECKKVNVSMCPDLMPYLNEYHIQYSQQSQVNRENTLMKSYFDIRDELFKKGSIEGASLAHRFAMPTIDDLIETLTNSSSIKKRFDDIYPRALETIAFKLRAHITTMPHLSGTTTLDLADAHVISFDLKPIVTESTENEARIRLFTEYLLAMNIGMKNFFAHESILTGMNPIYHNYWKQSINKFRNVDKCLNLDEWHALTIKKIDDDGNAVSIPVAGAMYIEWLVKEAPKWRLNINQASHSSSDFTSTMKEKATNIFIYSGTTGNEIEMLRKDFDLNPTQVEALKNLHGPNGKVGSQMLWLYSVDIPGMQGFRSSAKVEFLVKGSMLWGLNTNAKDLPHKIRLETEYSGRPWLQALCQTYPSGSMQDQRRGLYEQLRESNIEAQRQTVGIEDRLLEKAIEQLQIIEYGKDVLDDAAIIRSRFS